MSYLPYRCCCPNTERALDWQWHFDWTQHCCPVAYRHTANRFPCQLAGNLEILHRLIPNPNRNIYRINDRQIGLFQNCFDRHSCRCCPSTYLALKQAKLIRKLWARSAQASISMKVAGISAIAGGTLFYHGYCDNIMPYLALLCC